MNTELDNKLVKLFEQMHMSVDGFPVINLPLSQNMLNELEVLAENNLSFPSADQVLTVILYHICKGSQVPDSWEREFITKIGLIGDNQLFKEDRFNLFV